MESRVRDQIRRGVRAAVYHACWRRLDGDEAGAQSVLACELPAALTHAGEAPPDDMIVQGWIEEDAADFDRAVLISDLVDRRRRAGPPAPRPLVESSPAVSRAPVELPRPARAEGSPAIADLLDGMLAQDRRLRAAS